MREFRPLPRRAEAAAAAQGVSQRALAEAGPYLVYDQGIVNRDRGQRVFGRSLRVRRPHGREFPHAERAAAHQDVFAAFARAEKEYGVPPAVIAAFWDGERFRRQHGQPADAGSLCRSL